MDRNQTLCSGELGEDDLYEVLRHELREAVAAHPEEPGQVEGASEPR